MENIKTIIQKIVLRGFNLDTMSALESIAKTFGVNKERVCEVYIDIKNDVNKKNFEKTSKNKRIILLPQCLRNNSCKAEKDEDGYHCINCGNCSIPEINKLSKKEGYKIFILPGGSMAESIIEKYNPEAVIGIACYKELLLGAALLEAKKIPRFGFALLNSGCIETKIDLEKLKKIL